jgi:hypothetical protein
MMPVCLAECANGNRQVQGKENGPRIDSGKGTNKNIMPSGNAKENCYLKPVVIYLLIIWIIVGIPQSSAACVSFVCIEVIGIRPNVH